MARFNYRLQNVLNIKEKMESQAKSEFAFANKKLQEEQDYLAVLIQRKMDYEEIVRQLFQEVPMNCLAITENKNAVMKMEEFIMGQKARVHNAMNQLERQRELLAISMQERKTHEILKDYAFEEFLQDEKVSEGKEIDELTSYKYGQKER